MQQIISTVIVGAILAAIVILVIVLMLRSRKKGGRIGSGCVGCPNNPYCHRKSRNGCEAGRRARLEQSEKGQEH